MAWGWLRHVPMGTAMREVLREGYGREDLRADLLAGLTVGIVALPLAMALAIASGAPPQHGIYTAIVGGIIVALMGGSRLSVSGPTAAFVVLLLPVAQQFGLSGLLIATFLAGVILYLMGVGGMGRFIQFIPFPVVTGFTAGIAVVIVSLQLKDFLGLQMDGSDTHFLDRLTHIWEALPTISWADVTIGALTLAVLVGWRYLRIRIPGHLIALLFGTLAAWALAQLVPGFQVETIGSRFSFEWNGEWLSGIPPLPPLPVLPWTLPGPGGEPLALNYDTIKVLLGPALAIAVLGAIESLLCAVVVDSLGGTRHNPDAELRAQGIGNMVVPFFGGIAVTAAIARSATNVRAGARSPLAAVIHGLFMLVAVLAFAPALAHLPMASLAALLLVVAWHMSEAKHFAHIVRVAPKSDVSVLLTCFGLTVIFDMVIAVAVGVALAAFLFMQRMANVTDAKLLDAGHPLLSEPLPEGVQVFQIAGPLFFGATAKAVSALQHINRQSKIVVLDLGAVPVMDVSGLVALETVLKRLHQNGTCVVLAGVQAQPSKILRKAGIKDIEGKLAVCRTLEDALNRVRERIRAMSEAVAGV